MNPNTKVLFNRLSETPVANDIRISLFKQKTKNPFEENWIQTPEQRNTIKEATEKLTKNPKQNVGIFNDNKIMFIDIDSELTKNNMLYQTVLDVFKPTFMTKTHQGCHAIYYLTEDLPIEHINLIYEGKVLGEYRHNKHHTVEAGSIHPSGTEYTVLKDNPIAEFDMKDFQQLINIFTDGYRIKKRKATKEKKENTLLNTRTSGVSLQDVCKLINVDVKDFTKQKDREGREFYSWKGTLPNHESKTGKHATVKYFEISGHVAWNCFQHEGSETKRNYHTLKAMVNGECSCEDTADITDEIYSEVVENNNNEILSEVINTESEYMVLDIIKKDPVHDLLVKYNIYNDVINKTKNEKENFYLLSEFQKQSVKIIQQLKKDSPIGLCDVFIQYSVLKGHEAFFLDSKTGQIKKTYYSIIGDFIFNIFPGKYIDFVNSYKEEDITIRDINFEIITQYFEKVEEEAYNLNLNKWKANVNKNFEASDFNMILNTEVKQSYVVENFLPEKAIMLISSDPKVGKTFLVMHLQMCIATGRDFFGLKTNKSAVCMFDLENTQSITFPRYKGFVKGMGLNEDEIQDLKQNIHLQTKSDSLGFIKTVNGNIQVDEGVVNQAISYCIQKNIKVAIFDPLANMGQFSETNEDFQYIRQTVFSRFINNNISVVILHHHTKGKDKEGNGRARGGGSLLGFVNVAYSIKKDGMDNRRVMYATETRSGEVSGVTYDIDIKDKIHEDLSKEYEYIKLVKVEKTKGLSPEEKAVLECMENQEFYTTQEFCGLLFENGLYEPPNKLGQFNTHSLYRNQAVSSIWKFIDKLAKGKHEYKTTEGKKIQGNVWKLKTQQFAEDLEE